MSEFKEIKQHIRDCMPNPNLINSYSGQHKGHLTVQMNYGAILELDSYLKERLVQVETGNGRTKVKFEKQRSDNA